MELMKREVFNTRTMVKISALGAIAFVLMLFEFPLWFAPAFYEMDFSDVPSLIGSFALGPIAGVLIQLVKNLLILVFKGTDTAAVGEFSNFVVGSLFAFTAGYIYHRNKTFKNATIGMIAGIIVMTLVMSFVNYYVMIPLYAGIFGIPIDNIVAMGTALNANIVDLKSLIVFAVVPFNLFKGVLVTLVTTLIYKRVSPILHR